MTLLLAVLALAATSSVADAAKKKRAPKAAPAPAAQQMPGEPGAKVIAGYFREVGKIGQPVQKPAAKKGKKM